MSADGARAWLAEAIRRSGFAAAFPGYLHILGRLDAIRDPRVSVMAVSLAGERFRLHVNVDFFERAPQYLTGVLLHEVHHVVLGHLTHVTRREAVYPDLLEVAMEISANEYIGHPLPGRPCVWEDYQQFGLAPGQSTRERYELLAQSRREGRLPAIVLVPVDEHRLFDAPESGSTVTEKRRTMLETMLEGLARATDDDGGEPWEVAGRGLGELRQVPLEEADVAGAARMDWRAALEIFVGHLRQSVPSYARPNRRFPERIGQIPGRARRTACDSQPSLLVIIDTSASMEPPTLSAIAAQVRRLSTLARITIVECDCAVRRVYPYRGRLDAVTGRGGTDLRPPLQAGFLRRHRADGVVYFTDGQGPFPASAPPTRLLWALSGADPFECPWGTQIRLPL